LRDERILSIAKNLFAENGFSATTFENIAKQSRVALRTIYQQYGSKEEIFAAVIRRYVAHIYGLELQLNWTESIQDVLRRAAEKLVEFCTIPEAVTLQRLMIAESTRFPDLMLALSHDGHARTLGAIEAVLGEAVKRGLVVTDDLKLAARIFLEITVGWSLMFAAAGNRTIIPGKKELAQRVDVFLGTYGARKMRS
jgi:TetR/AcrR family transcriptional repressor of mexJK operon